jgi:hypothetical protein
MSKVWCRVYPYYGNEGPYAARQMQGSQTIGIHQHTKNVNIVSEHSLSQSQRFQLLDQLGRDGTSSFTCNEKTTGHPKNVWTPNKATELSTDKSAFQNSCSKDVLVHASCPWVLHLIPFLAEHGVLEFNSVIWCLDFSFLYV